MVSLIQLYFFQREKICYLTSNVFNVSWLSVKHLRTSRLMAKDNPVGKRHKSGAVVGPQSQFYTLLISSSRSVRLTMGRSPSTKMRTNNTLRTSLQYMENTPFSRGFYRNSGGITFCLKAVMEICFQKQTDVKNVRFHVNNF